MLESLLTAKDFALLEQGYMVGLDWLGQFARIIIEGVGFIGIGIVLFTLVLKAITLPFDIYQRVKMRKQTLIMRSMKDDLEKLQKQYADDKTTYNTKMMELYKKNGYSMFGACLPMIISLVILIVAFQGFRVYSQYANLDLFVGMSEAYNEAVLEYGASGTDYLLEKDEEGIPTVKDGKYTLVWTENEEEKSREFVWENGAILGDTGNLVYTMSEIGGHKYFEVRSADSKVNGKTAFLFYIYNLETATALREYRIDTEMMHADAEIDEGVEAIREAAAAAETPETLDYDTACIRYVVKLGSLAAKTWYNANNPSFLWVKNVWYPDVSYNHPIPDYNTFKSQLNVTVTLVSGEQRQLASVLDETKYENLTSELANEKSEPNGYFILILLSIGLMVLSQFITMRSQKESNQYQTVDGQGAKTQKMMLVIMPIIYAVFAFMYSAAFTIYMTVSSLLSLIVTLLSNLVIGQIFKKKEEQQIREQYGRVLSWKETQNADKKENKRQNGRKKR